MDVDQTPGGAFQLHELSDHQWTRNEEGEVAKNLPALTGLHMDSPSQTG